MTTDEATTELHQAIDDPAERQQVLDWRIVEDAWMGKRGPGQERIAKAGLAWLALILRKNRDYGDSVWQESVLAPECSIDTAIRVRMSDKISRLHNLLKGNSAEVAESINDTIRDLGAYCLLLLTRPDPLTTDSRNDN